MAKVIFRCISDCLYGTGEWDPSKAVPAAPAVPEVTLDSTAMGHEAVIVKNGSRLCGTGAARASTAIHQNKAYWEVKLQQSGVWSCGVCTASSDLNAALGKDAHSWVVTSDSVIKSRGEEEYKLTQQVQEGDVLGLTYDHVELNFYLNGVNLNCPVLGIKGTVYPVVYVDDGAILDTIFESFRCSVPNGFDRLMVEKALL